MGDNIKMLFTAKGKIYHEFLLFSGATFHYSTGYPISILYPNNCITPLHEYNTYKEPYKGYLSEYLKFNTKTNETNKTH